MNAPSRIQTGIAYSFLLALVGAGATAYLVMSGKDLQFVERVVSNPWTWVPDSAYPVLMEDSWVSVLAAVLVAMGHALAYTAAGSFLAFFAAWHLFFHRTAENENQRREMAARSKMAAYLGYPRRGVRMMLRYDDWEREALPYAVYARLDRKPVRGMKPSPRETKLRALERALAEILEAHASWPADPRGFHADTSLRDHSWHITEKLVEGTEGHPLARVLGLAHDIGKVLAYRRKKGKWTTTTGNHERLSMVVMRMLPEYQALPKKEQQDIKQVLTYTPTRRRRPKGEITEEQQTLIRALRIADGLGTNQERSQAQERASSDVVQERLAATLPTVLQEIRVNQAQEGKPPNGFACSTRGIVAIMEKALREKLAEVAPQDLARPLSLESQRPQGKVHPATKAVVQYLREEGLLLEAYKKEKASPDGLFDLRSGKIDFYGILLLDRDRVAERFPELNQTWEEPAYPLTPRTPADPQAETG